MSGSHTGLRMTFGGDSLVESLPPRAISPEPDRSRSVRRTPWFSLALVAALPLAACDDHLPEPQPAPLTAPTSAAGPQLPTSTLPQIVRQLAASRGIVPLGAPPPVRPALAKLGQALAFDRILSGNKDIACTTCHLPAFATGDGRSLSIGQGATGLGPLRIHPTGVFIPRNAPPL